MLFTEINAAAAAVSSLSSQNIMHRLLQPNNSDHVSERTSNNDEVWSKLDT